MPRSFREAYLLGREHLMAAGFESAAIEAEVILRHAAGLDRAALYARWTGSLAEATWRRYLDLLDARAGGRPVAYLVGEREFYGLPFHVDERVLIPRPETELLADTALREIGDVASPVLADVGTGSGAIAVTLAVRRSDATVYATDISDGALGVARLNAGRHGVAGRVRFLAGDALVPLLERGVRVHAVVANPPYVPPHASDELPAEIRDHEPPVAVLSPGPRGTEMHERIARQAPRALVPGGVLVMEVAAKWDQAGRVAEMLREAGYRGVRVVQDLAGLDRVVCARPPPLRIPAA